MSSITSNKITYEPVVKNSMTEKNVNIPTREVGAILGGLGPSAGGEPPTRLVSRPEGHVAAAGPILPGRSLAETSALVRKKV
jgi:hypothetical protein